MSKIEINREWLTRLILLKDAIESSVKPDGKIDTSILNHFLGYIDSAKLLIREDEKEKEN